MKSIRFFIYIFILITAFSVYAASQTNDSEIATVNTDIFRNKQNGIKEFIEAYEKLEIEFKPQTDELKVIAEKAIKLYHEIKELLALREKLNNSYITSHSPLIEKAEELQKLNIEYKEKSEKLQPLYDKRKAELLAESNKKVSDALKQFAKENGFKVILDSSKNYSLIITDADFADVTQKFIEFYNKQTETRP